MFIFLKFCRWNKFHPHFFIWDYRERKKMKWQKTGRKLWNVLSLCISNDERESTRKCINLKRAHLVSSCKSKHATWKKKTRTNEHCCKTTSNQTTDHNIALVTRIKRHIFMNDWLEYICIHSNKMCLKKNYVEKKSLKEKLIALNVLTKELFFRFRSVFFSITSSEECTFYVEI